MIHVIPVSDYSRSFYAQTMMFVEEHNLDPKMFSYGKCENLVVSLIYKALSEKFYWLDYEIDCCLSGFGVSDDNGSVDFSGIDSLIDNRLLNAEIEYVKALNRLFDWFIIDSEEEDLMEPSTLKEILLSNQYDSTVVDDVWLNVIQTINSAIPERTWIVWEVKKLGRDLIIKEKEDYRILDWMRRHKPSSAFVEKTTVNKPTPKGVGF